MEGISMKRVLNTFWKNIQTNGESLSVAKELVSDVSDILSKVGSPKTSKFVRYFNTAVTAYSAGITAHSAYNLTRSLFTENLPVYNIEISESDMLFSVVAGLMSKTQNNEHQSSIELRSRAIDRYDSSKREFNTYKDHLVGNDVIRFEGDKAFVYAVPGLQNQKTLEIAGHKVDIQIRRPDKAMLLGGYTGSSEVDPLAGLSSGNGRGSRGSSAKKFMQTTAIIMCNSEKAREEVMLFLRNNLSAIGKRKVVLYIGRSWGSFTGNSDLPERDISTVILKENQLENVINELTAFIDSEAKYNSLGVPYHHGILLSGPPGTGKSSTAKTVASHLGLDTYYIPLSSIKDNETFNELISEIKPRSVLLLEDIDTIKAAKDRTKKGGDGVTMDALLNVLDGVLSPHGVITIATTNHIEKLDPAVIRPGRVDTVYHVDHLNNEQLERICNKFLGGGPILFPDITGLEISPADVIGEIKKHIDDYDVAWNAVNTLIEKKISKKAKKSKKEEEEEMLNAKSGISTEAS
jgi:hypothetical protein